MNQRPPSSAASARTDGADDHGVPSRLERRPIADGLEHIIVQSRPGVTVGVTYSAPQRPAASVVLIEGGPGNPNIEEGRTDGRSSGRDRGFLVISEPYFREEGLAVALMRAPSDQGERLDGSFRNTGEHVRDVEAVIDFLKSEQPTQVWLVGMSLGSGSVGNVAVNSSKVDGGVVFVSSVSDEGEHNVMPARFRVLEKIAHPVLAIAHEKDGCPSARPECANDIIVKCENAPVKEVKLFSGGLNEGDHPCRPRTYHTYFGIEQEVAQYISGFIKANSQ